MPNGRVLFLAATTLSLLVSTAAAEILIVPTDFETLQEAVDASVDGDEIRIEPGRYTGPGFRLIETFAKEIRIHSASGPEHTILDGEFEGEIFYFSHGETPATIVEGFTITGGLGGSTSGGGITCYNSSPTIRNCLIAKNLVSGFIVGGGGGIHIVDSSPVFEGCTVTCNNSISDGGLEKPDGVGVYGDSHPVMRNSVVQGNRPAGFVDYDIVIGHEATLAVECGVLGTVFEEVPGSLQIGADTVSADPEFCATECPSSGFDPIEFRVSSSSGEPIGALGVGCPVASTPLAHGTLGFRMYPNPARNLLFLETGSLIPASVFAYDFQGRVMMDLTPGMSLARSRQSAIRLGDLPRGTYLLRIVFADGSVQSDKLLVH